MTHEEMQTPTVGFNITKELLTSIQDKLLFASTLQSSFTGITVEPDSIINILQKSQDDLVVIQSRNKYFVVPGGNTVKILCKNKYGVLDSRLPILDAADEIKCIIGLRVEETLVVVKGGPQNYITVPVTNTTQHVIFVPKNQLLQHLQLIKSVTSISVKSKPTPNVTVSKLLTSEVQVPSFNLYNNNSSPYTQEIIDAQHAKKVLEKIDLSELNQQQQTIARHMLIEKTDAF